MQRFKKIFSFILLFFVLLNGNSYSEVVKNIEIKGNERISKETIIVFGDISIGKDYNSSDLNSLIKKYEPVEYNEAPEDDYRKRILQP